MPSAASMLTTLTSRWSITVWMKPLRNCKKPLSKHAALHSGCLSHGFIKVAHCGGGSLSSIQNSIPFALRQIALPQLALSLPALCNYHRPIELNFPARASSEWVGLGFTDLDSKRCCGSKCSTGLPKLMHKRACTPSPFIILRLLFVSYFGESILNGSLLLKCQNQRAEQSNICSGEILKSNKNVTALKY